MSLSNTRIQGQVLPKTIPLKNVALIALFCVNPKAQILVTCTLLHQNDTWHLRLPYALGIFLQILQVWKSR